MNGILPARGGDAIKIVLAKRSVRGSSYAAIISSFVVLAPFDTGIGLVVLLYAITQGLLPAAPRLPELPAFDISFWAAHPDLLVLTITVLAIGLVVLIAVLARRIESFWQHLKQGVAIFRDPAPLPARGASPGRRPAGSFASPPSGSSSTPSTSAARSTTCCW